MAKNRRKLVANSADNETMVIVTAGSVLSGRYELVEEIGRGGMGIVFEARDRELDGKQIAIKVLPPEMSTNKAAVKRLKKEAIAAMELTHENVMRLHSFETDEQTAYLVIEYIDGEPLDERLADEEKLSFEETLEIMRGAVAGLSAAHRQGIIHRDIKPANLMYKTVGDEKVVRITDFGIAYVIKDSMTRLTGTESAGTLSYIAPEQLKGTRANTKTDQYSLAATAYELLSGEPPFVGAGLSHQILNAKPHLIEGIPEFANQALMRALSKDPEERFDDLNDFLQAFEGKGTLPEPEEVPDEEPEVVPLALVDEPEVEPEVEQGGTAEKPKSSMGLIALLLVSFLVIGGFLFLKRKESRRGRYARGHATPTAAVRVTQSAPQTLCELFITSIPKDIKVYDDNGNLVGRTDCLVNRPAGIQNFSFVVNAELTVPRTIKVRPGKGNRLFLDVPQYLLKLAREASSNEVAAKHYQQAANLGNVQAMASLGGLYYNGKGLPQNYEKAVYWYQRAAELGHAQGQFSLGLCYEEGNGVKQNAKKAEYWYKKAIDGGYGNARKQLEHLHDPKAPSNNNDSQEKRFNELLAKARRGDGNAQFAVGIAYLNGKLGQTRNRKEARRWLEMAASNGNQRAQKVLQTQFTRRRLPFGQRRPMAPNNLRIGR